MLEYKRHVELAEDLLSGASPTPVEVTVLAKLALAYLDEAAVMGTTEDHEDVDSLHMDMAGFYDENKALFGGNSTHESDQEYKRYQAEQRVWSKARRDQEDVLSAIFPRPQVTTKMNDWVDANPAPKRQW